MDFYSICIEGNHPNILQYIKESKYIINWNLGLNAACFTGNKELFDLMVLKGATDWNRALHYACCGGKKNMVNLLILMGANDFKDGMMHAFLSNHKEIIPILYAEYEPEKLKN